MLPVRAACSLSPRTTSESETDATRESRGNALNPDADIHLFGQEVNPETFAICKSDLFMKSEDGRDAERHPLREHALKRPARRNHGFDYMIANPPYGKNWRLRP